jgi:ParB family chromosome partitioning protein
VTKKTKKALGRGLDALFPEVNESVREESEIFISLSLESIERNPFQPRRNFNEEKLSEMAASIKERGLLQPILVRPSHNGYQLVAGERRLRAAKIAGLSNIPCILVHADDSQTLEIALIENLQRENLNPIEEARGYHELIDQFHFTQEDIAQHVGKDRSTVTNSLRLLKLPAPIQKDLETSKISSGHARAILSLEIQTQQKILWSRIIKEGLSVRQAEALSRDIKDKKAIKPPVKKPKSPNTVELEEKLMSAFGTRVQVLSRSKTRGKIIIHYSSLEDIDRILEKLGLSDKE